ncbi:vitamin B12 ABC transporter substrate-binding protein BtuF [Vibrio viridaestus]|uniref:Vitamin B12-binding protein n=1 Tax=Vibrio viridaestus TaxID=2487322 RepID=A0A3N9TGU6_9VIBR|nr:vitamin B12 ABC transporter substrate-binding protein BtuF [Vibrio viridaestus]RQW62983.1 vitamin B12 ABC transporter substrate-binding protein BtuF [Vibrio viridaestus]
MRFSYVVASTLLLFSHYIFASSDVHRIITLAPHATELAYAAGLGDKIVGVSDRSDYPPEAQSKPKVANYKGINIEKILALQPDLVISWPAGNPVKEVNKLKQMGVVMYDSRTQTLDDIATNIEELSQYADDPAIGKRNAQDFRNQLDALRKNYQDARKVSYFYQLSEKPIITMGQGSWPSEVFTFCGGVNVFADSPSPYPQVGLEQVVIAQPEVIFNSRHAVKDSSMWQSWTQIPAVKNHYIWTLNSDWINRPTPRTIEAIKEVCRYFDQVRKRTNSQP